MLTPLLKCNTKKEYLVTLTQELKVTGQVHNPQG